MRSVWSVLGPFVAKEAPRDRGCSWSLASIQYPIDCGAAGCDRRRKKGGVRGLYAYCFQQSSTGTNKVAATTALRKSGYSWEGERQNYELKNPMPNPLFCSWKKHLNFPVFFFFFPHGVNLWDSNVPLSCLFKNCFDNAFLGSNPEVSLHVFQLGKTPSVSTGAFPTEGKTNASRFNWEFHLRQQKRGPDLKFWGFGFKYHRTVSSWTAAQLHIVWLSPRVQRAEPSPAPCPQCSRGFGLHLGFPGFGGFNSTLNTASV